MNALVTRNPVKVTPRRILKVRKRLRSIRQAVDELHWETVQLLDEVHQHQYFRRWRFESFQQYAEAELRMRRRKAYYLISVAEAFRRLAIGPEERRGISMSNAVELAAATRDPATGRPRKLTSKKREAMLKNARTMTTRQLRDTIRRRKRPPAA